VILLLVLALAALVAAVPDALAVSVVLVTLAASVVLVTLAASVVVTLAVSVVLVNLVAPVVLLAVALFLVVAIAGPRDLVLADTGLGSGGDPTPGGRPGRLQAVGSIGGGRPWSGCGDRARW
jgi:uncharacterized membrane protein YgcG